MAIPFVVPSMEFRSKTAAKNYIRDEILYSYELRTKIDNPAHHQLLSEVLELHEHAAEKMGSGIDHFYVEETWRLPGKAAVARNLRAIIVVDSSGNSADWSYHHVIDSPSVAAQVKSALHFAIDAERLRRRDMVFDSGTVVRCAVTGEVIEQKHQADTRHLDPTWGELTQTWVDGVGGWDAVPTHSGRGTIFVGRDVENADLRDSWLSHYLEYSRPVFVKNELPRRPE